VKRLQPLSCGLILCVWLLMMIAGCAKVPPPPAEVAAPRTEGENLLAMWLERGEALHSLEGLATVKVKTPQGSLSGTQVVIAARPDRLRAETLGPFGIPLLSLAADGRQLTVLLPGDNLYYAGAASTENLARFTRMPIPPTALVDILLWQPPLVAFEELATFRTASGGWRLLLVSGPQRQELSFDAAARLEQVRYYSGDSLQLSVAYAGFADNSPLPRRIFLEQPPYALEASLEFREQSVNQPSPPGRFSLQPPPGVGIIPLDQPEKPTGVAR